MTCSNVFHSVFLSSARGKSKGWSLQPLRFECDANVWPLRWNKMLIHATQKQSADRFRKAIAEDLSRATSLFLAPHGAYAPYYMRRSDLFLERCLGPSARQMMWEAEPRRLDPYGGHLQHDSVRLILSLFSAIYAQFVHLPPSHNNNLHILHSSTNTRLST